MRFLTCWMVFATMAGCGSDEKKPNPLEKADLPLPVVTMPMGHFPSQAKESSRPLLTEKITAGMEVAVEGVMEVADPEAFRPRKMFVKFIHETPKRRVTAGTHMGGMPVSTKGNLYQYRNAIEAPRTPRRYVLEVYQGEELVTSAEIQVEKAKK